MLLFLLGRFTKVWLLRPRICVLYTLLVVSHDLTKRAKPFAALHLRYLHQHCISLLNICWHECEKWYLLNVLVYLFLLLLRTKILRYLHLYVYIGNMYFFLCDLPFFPQFFKNKISIKRNLPFLFQNKPGTRLDYCM